MIPLPLVVGPEINTQPPCCTEQLPALIDRHGSSCQGRRGDTLSHQAEALMKISDVQLAR